MKYLKYLYPAGLVFLGVAIGYAIVGLLIPNTWYYTFNRKVEVIEKIIEVPIVSTKIEVKEIIKEMPVEKIKIEKVISEVAVPSIKIQIVEKVVEVPIYREIIKEVEIIKYVPQKPDHECHPYGQWKKHNP